MTQVRSLVTSTALVTRGGWPLAEQTGEEEGCAFSPGCPPCTLQLLAEPPACHHPFSAGRSWVHPGVLSQKNLGAFLASSLLLPLTGQLPFTAMDREKHIQDSGFRDPPPHPKNAL